jgi:hypothetical protein
MSDGLAAPAVLVLKIAASAGKAAVGLKRAVLAAEGMLAGAAAATQLRNEMEAMNQLGVGLWIPPDVEGKGPGIDFSVRLADGTLVWYNTNDPFNPIPAPPGVVNGPGVELTPVVGEPVTVPAAPPEWGGFGDGGLGTPGDGGGD